MAPPLKLAFQAIDLCQSWPSSIGIEHFTGGEGAKFEATMALVDFLGGEKIGLNFAEAGLGIFGGKQSLDVFIQLWLVFLDREDVLALRFQNLSCQTALRVHGIRRNHFLRDFYKFQGLGSLDDLIFLAPNFHLGQHFRLCYIIVELPRFSGHMGACGLWGTSMQGFVPVG